VPEPIAAVPVVPVEDPATRSRVAGTILHALPEWFGLPESTERYVEEAAELETLVAGPPDEPLGFLTLRQHTPYATEIHVMGVAREHHRRGVGRALVRAALAALAARRVEYVQVKTLGPSHPSEGYARTRAFYEAVGFRPLEEIHGLWPESNPCLIMIRRVE
jgi:ribosomal protein S18 acetylase RimI-like enzyme